MEYLAMEKLAMCVNGHGKFSQGKIGRKKSPWKNLRWKNWQSKMIRDGPQISLQI